MMCYRNMEKVAGCCAAIVASHSSLPISIANACVALHAMSQGNRASCHNYTLGEPSMLRLKLPKFDGEELCKLHKWDNCSLARGTMCF